MPLFPPPQKGLAFSKLKPLPPPPTQNYDLYPLVLSAGYNFPPFLILRLLLNKSSRLFGVFSLLLGMLLPSGCLPRVSNLLLLVSFPGMNFFLPFSFFFRPHLPPSVLYCLVFPFVPLLCLGKSPVSFSPALVRRYFFPSHHLNPTVLWYHFFLPCWGSPFFSFFFKIFPPLKLPDSSFL